MPLHDIYNRIKTRLNPEIEIPNYPEYVTVYSHPRSGTHFLEAFIAKNFYKDVDLSTTATEWGHWNNRKIMENGNIYGKLFGSHQYPLSGHKRLNYPIIYIYRDGRAVAYSIWKTENFINPKEKGISFSDFLRKNIDWIGSPAFKCKEKMTIAEHWLRHVKGWEKIAKDNSNILFLNYEALINNPYSAYQKIHHKFFKDYILLGESEIDPIKKTVGLLPNQGTKDSWKSIFTTEDNAFFKAKVKGKYLFQ